MYKSVITKRIAGAITGLLLMAAMDAQAQPTTPRYAQRGLGRLVYRILNDTSSAATSRILVFPTLGYAPETSLEIGIRTFSLFYTKKDTAVNRLSEINLFAFVTVKGQFGGWLENAVYTNQNKYFFLGRARYQQFPLLYYGIGPETPPDNPTLVSSDFIQIRQRVLRKIAPDWYAGLEVDFQNLSRVSFATEGVHALPLPTGSAGSTSTGLGLALVYDDRKNILNVRKGKFMETGFLVYDRGFGSTFPYRAIVLDGRLYQPLGRQNRILATEVFATFMSGTVPFNNLALLGGENLMRGYYMGRYRDKKLVVVQSELRWLPFGFSKRWGGTVFAGLGTVTPQLDQLQFNQIRWAVGGGVRFLFFQKKDVFLRGDLGITREGTGIYLSLGEAF